jgi:ubiquinone/menaquinone biosynthesis C-methylase UbiE
MATAVLFAVISLGVPGPYVFIMCLSVVLPAVVSIATSFYVYDFSDLYSFNWVDDLHIRSSGEFLNINAGFDETSELLAKKFPTATFRVLDFYSEGSQTEASIGRARKKHSQFNDATKVDSSNLPIQNNSTDNIFVIFSAHEIRRSAERIDFFRELHRIVKGNGKIVVTEHLRDLPNLLAYTIGAFHFFPRSTWIGSFRDAGLKLCAEIKITPFVTTFVLEKHGTTY